MSALDRMFCAFSACPEQLGGVFSAPIIIGVRFKRGCSHGEHRSRREYTEDLMDRLF
jgi:hypothetical protein